MEAATVLHLLRESVRGIVSGENAVAVAYSGGLDSSIVAAVSREFATVRCYTFAVSDSFDAKVARERAGSESLNLTLKEVEPRMIPGIVGECGAMLGTSDPMRLAYTIPVIMVMRESKERLVLAGNGADELFGGYAKYASARDPTDMMANDIDKMLRENEDLARAAGALNRRIGFPFASKAIVEFARSMAVEKKIAESTRKVVLRDVAGMLRLPSQHLPKKAAQYSSGMLKGMEKLAKAEHMSLAEWTRRQTERLGESA